MFRCIVIALVLGSILSLPQAAVAQDGHAQTHDEAFANEHEAMPRQQQSMLMWTFNSLGWKYTLALPLAGLVSFVLALILVIRGGPYAVPALLLVVPIPLLIGAVGFFDGMIMSFQVIAMSQIAPKPSEWAEGISTSLVTPVVGMFLMAPAYLVAAGGLIVRTFSGERPVQNR
jgi:hypothetical protein